MKRRLSSTNLLSFRTNKNQVGKKRNSRLGKSYRRRPKWILTLSRKLQRRCDNFSIWTKRVETLWKTCSPKCSKIWKCGLSSAKSTFLPSSTRNSILWTISLPAAPCTASTIPSASSPKSINALTYADRGSRTATTSHIICRNRPRKNWKFAQSKLKTKRI